MSTAATPNSGRSATPAQPSPAGKPLPRVTSYGLVDARAAGGKLALIRLTSRGKDILANDVVGVYDNILDAVDAFYNYGHARWYVREPREGAGQEDAE